MQRLYNGEPVLLRADSSVRVNDTVNGNEKYCV